MKPTQPTILRVSPTGTGSSRNYYVRSSRLQLIPVMDYRQWMARASIRISAAFTPLPRVVQLARLSELGSTSVDTLYFACGWVIRPDTDYFRLRQFAAESRCDLAAVPPIYVSQQGYAVMTFAVRTPSEAWLVEFIKKAGVGMGLTHWYGVPEDYYARGSPFNLIELAPDVLATWRAGMQAYGKHNEDVRKKLEGKT
jgi:hypothetical protein